MGVINPLFFLTYNKKAGNFQLTDCTVFEGKVNGLTAVDLSDYSGIPTR